MSKEKSGIKKTEAPVKSRQPEKRNAEFETMSQQQNRSGKGRQQNGSDGSGVKGRGSNH